MKRYLIAALFPAIALVPAFAKDAQGIDRNAATTASTPSDTAAPTLDRMLQNTKRMQAQLEALRKTKDPAEREKLLEDHYRTMQETMALGEGVAPCYGGGYNMPHGYGMMGGYNGPRGYGMMGGYNMPHGYGMMGGYGGYGRMHGPAWDADDVDSRIDQMESRLNAMQSMMGQGAGGARTAPTK